ncbi:bifunctional 3-(3-hydroxy-phenyl)propionate/3-hydroxycinnamic acid hydroxylase [Streptomyces sp. NPDC102437]|uniref:bifunctional 3-(3-hydroxy-phenyl)propionate/3-hydroxycinnamic acid hydroxylase MhpA n=1 Tax=Streptomyces sp. NPDC102437 TaxID=3366175 RepID=UPI003813630F
MNEASIDLDVCIVGYGPVGQTLAALLGQKGWKVGVYERWELPYPLPRAGHVDDEIVRILQSIGVADRFEVRAVPATGYDWVDGNGDLLFQIDWGKPTKSSWRSDYIFYQPDLEALLSQAAEANESVSVHRGWEAVGLEQHEDRVEVTFRGGTQDGQGWEPNGATTTVRARYVIGADGANSFVRKAAGITWDDFGFSETLSIVDVRLHEPDREIAMPSSGQMCDPERPVTLFRWLAREHARWEFMLMPGEDPAELVSETSCWSKLERWGVTPENATLIRRTLYTFNSLVAHDFTSGRAILAGDAAHLMPPFLGQGMCSGIRDAANLAWKLDLVLKGTTSDDILETYTQERRDHVSEITRIAIALGAILCETDPEKAAARDAGIRRHGLPPVPPMPALTAGFLSKADGSSSARGRLGVQGLIVHEDKVKRFDDVAGSGWTLFCADRSLAEDARRICDAVSGLLTISVVYVSKAPVDFPGSYVDFDGTYNRWFASSNAQAILVRPDFYTYGQANTSAEVADLLSAMVSGLRNPLDATPGPC